MVTSLTGPNQELGFGEQSDGMAFRDSQECLDLQLMAGSFDVFLKKMKSDALISVSKYMYQLVVRHGFSIRTSTTFFTIQSRLWKSNFKFDTLYLQVCISIFSLKF
jgi:hypothetical protein